MALFGGSRDISLFHSLNKELINDLIQTEVAYYKFALEQTKANVYGEAPGKNYYEPLKIACLIDRQVINLGHQIILVLILIKQLSFQFFKNESLKEINLNT